MRARIGVFAVMLFVVVGFASPAVACDKCIDASTPGWKMCSSGYTNGYQSCYGGFGSACTLGDACGSGGGGGGIGDGPLSPDYVVAVHPCLTCAGSEPEQGFVLRSESATSEGLAKRSAPRSSRR